MINREAMGKRIAFHRKRHNMSQSALAEQLNITAQAVSKWECGQAVPDVELLIELSWLFSVSINDLVEDDPMPFMPENGALPGELEGNDDATRRLLAAVEPYFAQDELCAIAISLGELELSMAISAQLAEKQRQVEISLDKLSQETLVDLSAELAEAISILTKPIDRGLRRILASLRCPLCGGALSVVLADGDAPRVRCPGGHTYAITDGVLDCCGGEAAGAPWSLRFKNYAQFRSQRGAGYPDAERRAIAAEAIWEQLVRTRPRVILDLCCGDARGTQHYVSRINWPCTVILADLSHRVLKYNRQLFREEANDYVDIACIACDGANLPLADQCVDAVVSFEGFQSMGIRCDDGLEEVYRVLKQSGVALYTMPLIAGGADSERWISLMCQDAGTEPEGISRLMIDLPQWRKRCRRAGFQITGANRLCAELPPPDSGAFPFADHVFRWMALYLVDSRRR